MLSDNMALLLIKYFLYSSFLKSYVFSENMALSPGDPSSYSRPELVKTNHIHLDLDLDFDALGWSDSDLKCPS